MNLSISSAVLLVLLQLVWQAAGEYVINSFQGIVGAGNYSYYKLTLEGQFQLLLHTTQGDSDLYVSDMVLHPTYEDNELQSVTCGDDEVTIDSNMKRPVGIAVYGHPSHHESTYIMSLVTSNPQSHESDDESYTSLPFIFSEKRTGGDEESVLWTILVSILKIAFDILL